jgi:hypothetical protein
MPLLDLDVITNAVHNLVAFLGTQDLALGSTKALVASEVAGVGTKCMHNTCVC